MLKLLCFVLISFSCFSAETLIGKASYYTIASCQKEGTSGVFTASGKKYDESKMTCALRCRDWGSKWKVTNQDTGKSIEVTLTDFGPGKKPTSNGVVIDLTPSAYEALGGSKRDGLIKNVKVERIKG